MSKHISRNGGATIKASRKTASRKIAHDKVFFILGQKSHYFQPKNGGTMKKVIALNLYISTNVLVYERWLVLKVWYTATRPNAFAILIFCVFQISRGFKVFTLKFQAIVRVQGSKINSRLFKVFKEPWEPFYT